MPKTHKLLEVEQKHLTSLTNVVGALNSWSNTLEYLITLVEKDRLNYVEKTVRPRLGIKLNKTDKPDIHIDAEKGTVEEL